MDMMLLTSVQVGGSSINLLVYEFSLMSRDFDLPRHDSASSFSYFGEGL